MKKKIAVAVDCLICLPFLPIAVIVCVLEWIDRNLNES